MRSTTTQGRSPSRNSSEIRKREAGRCLASRGAATGTYWFPYACLTFGARLIVARLGCWSTIGIERATTYLGKNWRYQAFTQYQDRIISLLPADPLGVLLALWVPGQKGVGARRVDLRNGKLKTIAHPRPGTLGWASDHEGTVRIGWGQSGMSTRRFIVGRTDGDSRFEEILRWDPKEESGFSFAGFSEDKRKIYVFANSEQLRTALFSYDLEARRLGKPIFEHPSVDVRSILTSKVDGRLVGVSYIDEKPKIHYFDPEFARMQAQIDAALPGRINRMVSADRSEQRFIVRSSADIAPPTYLVFDRKANSLSVLFEAYPELAKVKMAPMEPIRCAARDGLEIPGYLTRPPRGKPPYPLIVMPHGGPWARDVWGWDPTVQFFASRGFAVLTAELSRFLGLRPSVQCARAGPLGPRNAG